MKKWMKLSGIIASTVVLAACANQDSQQDKTTAVVVPIEQADDALTIEDVSIALYSEIWLNSMPMIEDEGSVGIGASSAAKGRLLASIQLLSPQSDALYQGIKVKQIVLKNAEQQWLLTANDDNDFDVNIMEQSYLQNSMGQNGESYQSGVEFMLRDGPNWAPASLVDVTVTLVKSGKEYTITQRDVTVNQVF
ncbi:hypothetical protein [Photobacterium profundum]|uniref:Lipoprotein n=1 Tax=Photobacterium profundum 3TCK TaxID=314280 RepID=Q1Z196_9GAMM|nr:hypothetical protein [Photobacterium profundum]EAS42300.1 hypothetical protein P3TCK_13630 [Photobacterium profundum 3TCK]